MNRVLLATSLGIVALAAALVWSRGRGCDICEHSHSIESDAALRGIVERLEVCVDRSSDATARAEHVRDHFVAAVSRVLREP